MQRLEWHHIEKTMHINIKQATQKDFSALQSIELAAFETLSVAGAVSGVPTASSNEMLQTYCDEALLYAAFDLKGNPVGFAGAYVDEGWLHIAEIDVHPDFQSKGIGRQLMLTLLGEARTRQLHGATLTTDRLVPFNAPFYASLGFQIVELNKCPERLKNILCAEKAIGLDLPRRVAMIKVF